MGKIAGCNNVVQYIYCQSVSSWSNLWCLLAWLALRHFPLYCVHGVCTERSRTHWHVITKRETTETTSLNGQQTLLRSVLEGKMLLDRRPNGQHPPFPCKEPNWGKLGGDKCRILHSSDSSEHAKARSKQTRNLEVFCKFLWLDDAKWHYF